MQWLLLIWTRARPVQLNSQMRHQIVFSKYYCAYTQHTKNYVEDLRTRGNRNWNLFPHISNVTHEWQNTLLKNLSAHRKQLETEMYFFPHISNTTHDTLLKNLCARRKHFESEMWCCTCELSCWPGVSIYVRHAKKERLARRWWGCLRQEKCRKCWAKFGLTKWQILNHKRKNKHFFKNSLRVKT